MTIESVTTEDENGSPVNAWDKRWVSLHHAYPANWISSAQVGRPTLSKLPTCIFATMTILIPICR